jgi:hypothetical protein
MKTIWTTLIGARGSARAGSSAASERIAIDADDIGGAVTSAKGRPGVW